MLTNRQAVSKIKKIYNKKYKQYDDIIEWGVDTDNERVYTWNLVLEGKRIKIQCDKATGKVAVL